VFWGPHLLIASTMLSIPFPHISHQDLKIKNWKVRLVRLMMNFKLTIDTVPLNSLGRFVGGSTVKKYSILLTMTQLTAIKNQARSC